VGFFERETERSPELIPARPATGCTLLLRWGSEAKRGSIGILARDVLRANTYTSGDVYNTGKEAEIDRQRKKSIERARK